MGEVLGPWITFGLVFSFKGMSIHPLSPRRRPGSILMPAHRFSTDVLRKRRHFRIGPGLRRGDSRWVLVLSMRSKALLVDTPTYLATRAATRP